ncbi:uncharacterized protein TNCV_44041 [Trichonephila clavipes]|nr:uncharacterized protein TNCV_44041 [Trichonephila clavipes]
MECWRGFGRINVFWRRSLFDPGVDGRVKEGSLVVFAGGKCGIVLDWREWDSLGERLTTGCGLPEIPTTIKAGYLNYGMRTYIPNPMRCFKCQSDEAPFWLNGYVNKQNCRIWSKANPQVYVETSLHPEKLTVWCALWAGGILLQKR